MIGAILLYTNLNFCSELHKASALRNEQRVEQILRERVEKEKPKDPWVFFQKELKQCGIKMRINPQSSQSTGPSPSIPEPSLVGS